MKYYPLILLIFTSGLLLQACSEKPLSKEDEIKQYIESGKKAAEERSAGDVIEMVHDDYSDHKNMDKLQLKNLLRAYFFRHKNIHLFTRLESIKFYGDNEADVVLHVAMAGKAISDASFLSSLRARVYTFKLLLVKQDEWLLKQASWKPADLSRVQDQAAFEQRQSSTR